VARPSTPASPIEHRDRIVVVGMTESGKSWIARQIFLAAAGPKLVIDPTDSEICDVPGAVVARDPERVDLSAPVSRFVPRDPCDLKAYDTLYGRINALPGPFYVWDDECRFSMPANGTPPQARTYVITKRKRQMGWLGCNTRALDLFKECKGAARHIISTEMGSTDDREDLAKYLSIRPGEMDAIYSELEPFGFWWFTRRDRTVTVCPPIPWKDLK